MKVQSYRDLIAWQKAMDLAVRIYEATKSFPRDELYGLTSQMRRSAVSIPSNVAEGHARDSTKEFVYFLSIATGSLAELETQLLLAERLAFLESETARSRLDECTELGRILFGLKRSLPSH
jgi:four helix bundle protein